jgi:hypothetical protein
MTFRKPPDEGGQRSGGQRFYPELARTGGGIRLACSPQDINIGKLIRHTEGEIDLAGCGECRLTESAASRAHWILRLRRFSRCWSAIRWLK